VHLANLTDGIAQDFVACSSNHRGVKTCIHGRRLGAVKVQAW
jgi:hypothetical protein